MVLLVQKIIQEMFKKNNPERLIRKYNAAPTIVRSCSSELLPFL